MTLQEFNDEFDIIYENISKGGAPGLIPYEKSVILTQAAEYLAQQLAVEDISLVANLIQTEKVTPTVIGGIDKLDSRSVLFEIPVTTLKILNESVEATTPTETLTVIPLSSVEYTLSMVKPYRYPRRRMAWRLETSNLTNGMVEIIGRSGSTLNTYVVRILNLPEPIILTTLTGIQKIRNKQTAQNTNLLASLHPRILNVATTLAEKYYLDKYGQDGSQNNQ